MKNYSINNSFSTFKIVSEFLNLSAIGLLSVILLFYHQQNDKLIDLYQFFMPLTDWITYPVFFIDWIVNASLEPLKAKAYITLVYLIFTFIYLNLYLTTKPAFKGLPKSYEISFQGLFDFIEDYIYSQHNLSLSLAFINKMNRSETVQINVLHTCDSYQELLKKYFKAIGSQYIGFFIITGFLFLPWLAYDKVNNYGLSMTPFWLAVVGFSYFQTRFLFEASILASAFLKKNKY